MKNYKSQTYNRFLNFFMENKIIFMLLLLLLGMTIASDAFLTSRNILNVLRQISTSALIGLGFTLVVASGNLDLSVGTMLGLTGVVMAKLSLIPGMPLPVAILLGLLFGISLGALNGFLISYLNLNGFVATLATAMVFKGVAYLICGNAAVGGLSDTFKIFGQGYVWIIPVPVIIMCIMAVILMIFLKYTWYGRHIIAIGGNAEGAKAAGIDVEKTRRLAYIIMGFFAGMAALIMTGRLGSAQQTAGQGMEMDAIAAVVLGGTSLSGGKAKVLGTILGCFAVGIINNGLNLAHVDANWQIVVKGLLIIIAIIIDSQSQKFMTKLQVRNSGSDME